MFPVQTTGSTVTNLIACTAVAAGVAALWRFAGATDFRSAEVHRTTIPPSAGTVNRQHGQKLKALIQRSHQDPISGRRSAGKKPLSRCKIGASMTRVNVGDEQQSARSNRGADHAVRVPRRSAHMRKVIDGPVGDGAAGQSHQQPGAGRTGWMDSGSRALFTKKPVTSPADLKGVKRAQSAPAVRMP